MNAPHPNPEHTDPSGDPRDNERQAARLFDLLRGADPRAVEQWVLKQTAHTNPDVANRLALLLRETETTHAADPAKTQHEDPTATLSFDPSPEPAFPVEAAMGPKERSGLEPGSTCGPFRIERVLGSGGMGTVYLADRIDDLDLKVALKTLFLPNERSRLLFQREYRILAGLRHPNIAHVIDAGALPSGHPWFAMEYVAGQTLDRYLTNERPDLKARLTLFLAVCSALSHAHQHMIIHRDLKPHNIMVQTNGSPKLLDFGLAASLNPDTGKQNTVTIQADQMMTPAYASPEQVNGGRLSATSDVYSLGMVFYEVLTGKRAYEVDTHNLRDLVHAVNEAPIVKPSLVQDPNNPHIGLFQRQLRGDLNRIALKALERDPAERYASVEAFAADVRAYMGGLPISARPATRLYRFRKFLARNPWPMGFAGVLILGLTLFSSFAASQRVAIMQERDRVAKEKRTAEQVTQFLISLFEQVDPDLTPSGQVSAYDVMEQGRRQVSHTLADEPEVQRRLMTTMGRVYRALGFHEQSQALLEKALLRVPEQDHEAYPAKLELVRTLIARNQFTVAEKHLEELLDRWDLETAPEKARLLAHTQAHLYLLQGRYRQAFALFENLAPDVHRLPSREQETYHRHRAELLSLLGRYQDALTEQRRLLTVLRDRHGETHSEIAETLMAVTTQKMHLGQLDEARQTLGQAEEIYQSLFGDDHPWRVLCTARHAEILKAQAHYAEAAPLLTAGLEMARKYYGENHLQTAAMLNILGAVHHDEGRLTEAETYYRQALNMRIALLGEQHVLVAGSLNDLAVLLNHQGQPETAEHLYRRAVAIQVSQIGDRHPHVGQVLNSLAVLLKNQGRYDEAEPLYRRSLAINMAALGEKHPLVAANYHTLGAFYHAQRNFEEAEHSYLKAMILRRELFGETHPRMLSTLNNLGALYLTQGRYKDAEPLLHKVYSARTATYGVDHLRAAVSTQNWGALLAAKGAYQEAETQLQQALRVYTAALGRKHRRVIVCEAALGELYLSMGDLKRAEQHYRTALTLGSALLEETHVELIEWRTALAEILLLGGNPSAAEANLLQAETVAQSLSTKGPLAMVHKVRALQFRQEGALAKAESLLRRLLAEHGGKKARAFEEGAEIRLELADLLAVRGNMKEANPLLTEAAAYFGAHLPANHEKHLVVQSIRGFLLRESGQTDEARSLLDSSLQALEDRLGSRHYFTQAARARAAPKTVH
ncbi:serine/threonine-protein kinase [Acanthopleuribacter pedis]|uniref:Serine/threonine protein kinase n=1 Tax=Acanthopleuribacter pedis TaxID=442870 RepID=A0A8J7Q8M1_9BACT|nr:serine/threonine-protein kinase [Acanthopleuribacter pedis]MBO1322537.1 serine/threonine protein kinase [Acanthopleuribacter pedis]